MAKLPRTARERSSPSSGAGRRGGQVAATEGPAAPVCKECANVQVPKKDIGGDPRAGLTTDRGGCALEGGHAADEHGAGGAVVTQWIQGISLVSPLRADGRPHPGIVRNDGHVPHTARPRKEARYPELMRLGHERLVCLICVQALARLRTPRDPASWHPHAGGLLSCAQQRAVGSTLLGFVGLPLTARD